MKAICLVFVVCRTVAVLYVVIIAINLSETRTRTREDPRWAVIFLSCAVLQCHNCSFTKRFY